jgi:predicted transglutaminase-like cysteine proteinase
LFLLLCSTEIFATNHWFIAPEFQMKIRLKYGHAAESRVRELNKLITNEQDANEWTKINKINNFFNTAIDYKNDLSLWGVNDYWALPIETIFRGLGDCEDYVIAKYFSLIALGINEDKLRLMYVRHIKANEPHMVLIYLENQKSVSLVLDNNNPDILPTHKRIDLKPIYSFNSKGVWMEKSNGLARKVNNSPGVSAWNNLIKKLILYKEL